MLLVNGNSGIGNGFAQKILSRNISEVIDFILKTIQGKKVPTGLLPYYAGFKGEVKRIENFSYEITGRFDRTNTTTITIDELPVGYDLEKYNAILAKLEEDKVIQDYTDKSHENKFLFEVKVTREFTKKDDEWIAQKLKLISRTTENFTCIGINNEIVEYKDEISILNDFILVRLDYYEKRKTYQIEKIKKELLTLGAKYYFVKGIIEDTIIVNKRPKADIEKQILATKGFPFKDFESLDFLLNMPIHSMSKETFNDLKEQIDKKKIELKEVTEKKVEDTWTEELNELKKVLK
jgi:DNA topoisomerase-2